MMHRALCLPEVLIQICTSLESKSDCLALANLARCSKFCHEISIGVLWRDTSLLHLIKCFPEDTWSIVGSEMTLLRSLIQDDWTRFLHYSQHVRHLSVGHSRYPYTPNSHIKIHDQVLLNIVALRPHTYILPKLQTLYWREYGNRDEYLSAVLSFCGQGLRSLTIHWSLRDDPQQVFRSALSFVADRFPRLEEMQLYLTHDAHLVPIASPPVAFLSPNQVNLTKFHFQHVPLEEDVFNTLSQLQSLRVARIALPEDRDWLSTRLPGRAFPALRDLSLVSTLRSYIAFSRKVNLPHLSRFVLSFAGVPTGHEVSALFSSIRNQCSPRALTELLVAPQERIEEPTGVVLRSSDLQPLREFTELCLLMIHMPCTLELDDHIYVEMADAWCGMNDFTLQGSPDADHTFPALHTLWSFALHCPVLKFLAIPFDARLPAQLHPTEIQDMLPEGTSKRSSLRCLDVGGCPISHPQCVAALIAHMFPDLGKVYESNPFPDTEEGQIWAKNWEEVDLYLPWFKTIRADERRRMESEGWTNPSS
ncbi:hypothetical protein C8Q74DRAFT_869217 [Fomes fomentarius]|nr:hypothetical protein C8Q74DRAFT_869217 [Fomes fomentarius]